MRQRMRSRRSWVEALLLEDVPSAEREDDARERRDEYDVLQEEIALPEARPEERHRGAREQALENEGQSADRENEEPAEDEGVVEAAYGSRNIFFWKSPYVRTWTNRAHGRSSRSSERPAPS